jgi:RimJ/RimL family protein N-acetyltransferase
VTFLLQWRPFEKADRPALRRFVCTDPESKSWDGHTKSHPRPWEHSVQCSLREYKPNKNRGEVMIIGFDDQGIGAVCAWARYDDPGRVLLQLIAVAMRHRGRDRSCAKEALQTAMGMISEDARKGGATRLLLQGRIDHRNAASRRLCGEAGFVYEQLQR